MPKINELLPVYQAALALADEHLAPELCAEPWPMMAAVIGVLSASEESPHLPNESKLAVTNAIRFLAERLAAVASVVDPSTPTINATNLLPSGAVKKGPARTMLQDIARGLARRVPLTKLVALYRDVRPCLASLMVSALHTAGDTLVIPEDMKLKTLTLENFNALLKEKAGENYDNYGMIAEEL